MAVCARPQPLENTRARAPDQTCVQFKVLKPRVVYDQVYKLPQLQGKFAHGGTFDVTNNVRSPNEFSGKLAGSRPSEKNHQAIN
jgi:hypothetical protein